VIQGLMSAQESEKLVSFLPGRWQVKEKRMKFLSKPI
jgi:hypothetical protein